MKYTFAIFLSFVSLFLITPTSEATENTSYTSFDSMWVLMNHQDFDAAFREMDAYMLTGSMIENMTYADAIGYINIQHFRKKSASDFLTQYLIYHPWDIQRSALITRRELGRSTTRDCFGEKMLSSSDLVDQSFCILQNKKYASGLKKRRILTLIQKAESKFPDETTLQKVQLQSDLLNLISYTLNHLRQRLTAHEKAYLVSKQKTLSESIIAYDPHFVNGYFGLFATADKNDCTTLRTIRSNLLANYIGDATRKKQIIDPAIETYLSGCQ